MNIKSIALLLTTLAALLLSACGTTPLTNFYTLSPQSAVKSTSENVAGEKIIIGVGPIDIAPYIDRNQIVIRSAETRLKLTDVDHWAAPLSDTIANVLAVNISHQLPETQPIVRPWPDAKAQYTVVIKVIQFDSDLSGKVQLKANWAVQSGQSLSFTRIAYSDIEKASLGASYDAITQNLSAALAALSDEISAELDQQINLSQ